MLFSGNNGEMSDECDVHRAEFFELQSMALNEDSLGFQLRVGVQMQFNDNSLGSDVY